jgi:hypothetical protein
VTALRRALLAEAGRTWRHGGTPVRFAVVVGALLMVAGVVHGIGFLVAGGPWMGPVAWRKPFAFGLSFGMTTVTVAWFVSRLRVGRRARWLLLGPLAAATTTEVAWVSVQRARGVPSHFNFTTPADEIAFQVAGGGAIGVTVLVLVAVTVLAWRRPDAPPALASAMRAGLAVLLVSQAVGSVMIQRGIASVLRGEPASHAVAPAGDLKLVHAVAMHGIQVLPVLALWLLALHGSSVVARTGVRIGSAGYALVVAATVLVAAAGRPVTDPQPLPAALAVVGMLAAVPVGWMLLGAPRLQRAT